MQRRTDQDRDGIEAEIIYGILGISRGLSGRRGIGDHALLAAVYHGYNEYIAEFNRSMPGHYVGLGCLPNHDAQAAADEARHCASLGLKGATLVPWGAAMPVWHEMWEPVWTTAAPMQLDEVLASVILAGVCERHPKLRLVLGESGIGWIPYLLERLDDTWEERRPMIARSRCGAPDRRGGTTKLHHQLRRGRNPRAPASQAGTRRGA